MVLSFLSRPPWPRSLPKTVADVMRSRALKTSSSSMTRARLYTALARAYETVSAPLPTSVGVRHTYNSLFLAAAQRYACASNRSEISVLELRHVLFQGAGP